MLSMLSWQSAPLPLGKKAQVKTHQNVMAHVPRTIAVQTHTLASQTAPTYAYTISGSYVYDSRPPHGHAGQTAQKSTAAFAQTPTTQYAPALTSSVVAEHAAGERNKVPTNRSYKIYPSVLSPDAFVYERSEDARSETLTSYSTDSAETSSIHSSTTATSSTLTQPEMTGRDNRRPPLMIANAGRRTSSVSPHSSPDSPNVPSSSGSALAAKGQGLSPPRTGDDTPNYNGQRVAGRRRGSGSDSDDTATRSRNLLVKRPSPPRTGNGVRFPSQSPRDGYSSENPDPRPAFARDRVPNGLPTPALATREMPPMHRDDSRTDMTRSRRLSGAFVPNGIRERHSPDSANGREVSPSLSASATGAIRAAPSSDRSFPMMVDGPRERISPDRERAGMDFPRERRVSGATLPSTMNAIYDRPPVPKNSSSSSRDRHSPPLSHMVDDAPRGPPVTSIPIRERTLSNKDDMLMDLRQPPRPIVNVEALAQCRSVRFSERLICPSPVPPDRRRKGWFNKRGDQLWTNEGVFVSPEPGTEYPPELDEYPDTGLGWMNEEGIRIDMQHRLVPKGPLRPALKRSSTSGSSAGTQAMARSESRAIYASSSIRVEN